MRIGSAAFFFAAAFIGQAGADYIDSINPNAAPEDFATYGITNVGWYYTPTQSYSLTGISTFFAFSEYAPPSQTVTVQIQSATPASGGTLLAQGTFTANGSGDNAVGANFASPVQLTAGTSYFVDFLNVEGLGSNVGQYSVENGMHVPAVGATTRLDAFYVGFGSDDSFATSRVGDAADHTNGFGSFSGVEPILYFSGSPNAIPAVPEPSSVLLVTSGLATVGVLVRRRRGHRRAAIESAEVGEPTLSPGGEWTPAQE